MTVLPRLSSIPHRVVGLLLMIALTAATPFASATLVHGTDTLKGSAFDTWQEPSDTAWRFACQTPCAIPLPTLQAAANGFLAAKQQLLGFSGIDTVVELQPVDIFFESNSICPPYPGIAGYTSTYFPYAGNIRRAYSCLFLWDYQQSGQIQYFTPASAGLASSQTLIVHEYAHSIFFNRHVRSYEDFVRYWSYRIGGTVPLPQGMCSENLVTYSAPLVYQLCQQFGADDSDVRASLILLDWLYRAGAPYNKPSTSISQLRERFDARLGVSTGLAWLQLGYAPQEVGAEIIPIRWEPNFHVYDFAMPDGSFKVTGISSQSIPMKLEQPSCLPTHAFINFRLAFDFVALAHQEGDGIAPPQFPDGPLQVTYSYAHAEPLDGLNPANYRLYRATGSCGQVGIYWQEIPAILNTQLKTVRADLARGGTYALMQPDELFSDGFE